VIIHSFFLFFLVGRGRFELPTNGLKGNPLFTINRDRKYIRSKSTSKQGGHFLSLSPCFFRPRAGRSMLQDTALSALLMAKQAAFCAVFFSIPRLTPEVLAGASRRFPVGCERENPCRHRRNSRCASALCTRQTPGMMFTTNCFDVLIPGCVVDGSSLSP
jgi:hypothetical protein